VLHALRDDGMDRQFALVEHGGGLPLGGRGRSRLAGDRGNGRSCLFARRIAEIDGRLLAESGLDVGKAPGLGLSALGRGVDRCFFIYIRTNCTTKTRPPIAPNLSLSRRGEIRRCWNDPAGGRARATAGITVNREAVLRLSPQGWARIANDRRASAPGRLALTTSVAEANQKDGPRWSDLGRSRCF
jgi:hypothetical protein